MGGPRRCVLVVEDEEAHAELVRRAFLGHPIFDVVAAASVGDARRRLESQAIDVVITDLLLPDGRGMELAAVVGRAVPIVVMTSHGSERTAVEALRAGALDYVVKSPESFADLPRVAERAVREWEALRERERIARELEETQARLDEAQRVAQIGSWTFELSTGRAWLSEEARRLFGLPPDAPCVEADRLVEQLVPEDRARVAALVAAASTPGGAPYEVTVRMASEDAVRVRRFTGQPVEGPDGRPARLVGTIQDVTERHRLEEDLRHAQKMEAVGTLAGGIAHDFNNLLMGIRGCLEMALERTPAGAGARRFLDAALQASISGSSITRQLLAFSRRADADPTVVELDEIVAGTREMLQRLLGEDVRLQVRLGGGGNEVRVDRGEVEQVLMNLAANARDAMPRGGGLAVETSVAQVGPAGGRPAGLAPGTYVLLRVRDEGVGMSERTRERAFEPFFTTKPPGKGTGLGLPTIYGIVRRAGGHVEIDSAPGQGTTFLIWLPRASAPQAPRAEPARTGARRVGTVLVVEDDALVRAALRRYLERAGWTVLEAGDGEEALRVLRDAPTRIDTVLTDMVLPRGSGPEVAAAVRAAAPGVRTVYMSAHPFDHLVEERRLAADAAFLQKPFGEEALMAVVGYVAGAVHREAPGTDPDPGARGPRTPAAGARRRAGTVLLAEDHDATRLAFGELLEEEGWEVLPAAGGPEALALCAAAGARVDVLIADLGLPGLPGAELAAAVRARFPSAGVVFVSGRDPSDPALRRALEAPRTVFVPKPVELAAVLRAAASVRAREPERS